MSLLATFGLILICCHAWAIETNGYLPISVSQDVYATKIEEFLEKLKGILKTGDEQFGLPPLDPFRSEKLPLDINTEIFTLKALLTNLDARGLSKYTVNSGDFSLIGVKLSFDLTWPLLYAVTNYTMNSTVGQEIQIYGTGNITAVVKDFHFSIETTFTTKDDHLEMKSIDTDFDLKELEFKVSGLLDDEEVSMMLSVLISDIVPELVHEYKSEIKTYVHPLITKLANDFLADKSISDIIKIIGM